MTDSIGYCHFNEGGAGSCCNSFRIDLFGESLEIYQTPSDTTIGHAAVVWDAAVVFSKYMEFNSKQFDPAKIKKKKVFELGSGTGLAGAFLRSVLLSLSSAIE